MSRMDEFQREIKAVLKKYEGYSIAPRMKENECDVIVRMNKSHIRKVFVVTCDGITNVVSIPVTHGLPIVIPIAITDGVVDLMMDVIYR